MSQSHTADNGGALRKLELICDEIFERWDKDQRSGKLLSALAGRLPRYRADVDEVRAALTALERQAWQPIASAPNDSGLRWYGLHVQHTKGHSWFEAHYLSHDDDGQMREPSGDDFTDWAFSDFEFWCAAPPPPQVAEHREVK